MLDEVPPVTMDDVVQALHRGGLEKLAVDGRVLLLPGRRGVVVMSLVTPKTGWLLRMEEV